MGASRSEPDHPGGGGGVVNGVVKSTSVHGALGPVGQQLAAADRCY